MLQTLWGNVLRKGKCFLFHSLQFDNLLSDLYLLSVGVFLSLDVLCFDTWIVRIEFVGVVEFGFHANGS